MVKSDSNPIFHVMVKSRGSIRKYWISSISEYFSISYPIKINYLYTCKNETVLYTDFVPPISSWDRPLFIVWTVHFHKYKLYSQKNLRKNYFIMSRNYFMWEWHFASHSSASCCKNCVYWVLRIWTGMKEGPKSGPWRGTGWELG